MGIDLEHLKNCVIKYLQPATKDKPERSYDVEVHYSDHCYKKRIYENKANPRTFDEERYELSKQLPNIIPKLMDYDCYFTGKGNFFTIDIDINRSYEIYFRVKKVNKKLLLYIESAYVRKPELKMYTPSKKQKISFGVILYKVWHNIQFSKQK